MNIDLLSHEKNRKNDTFFFFKFRCPSEKSLENNIHCTCTYTCICNNLIFLLFLKSTIKLNYMAVKYLKEHTGIYLIRFSSSVLNLHTLQFIFKWFLGDNMFVVFPFYFSSFFFFVMLCDGFFSLFFIDIYFF